MADASHPIQRQGKSEKQHHLRQMLPSKTIPPLLVDHFEHMTFPRFLKIISDCCRLCKIWDISNPDQHDSVTWNKGSKIQDVMGNVILG